MKKALHQLVPIIIFCIGLNSFAQTEKGKFLVGARTTLNAGVIEHSRVNEKMKRGTDIALRQLGVLQTAIATTSLYMPI